MNKRTIDMLYGQKEKPACMVSCRSLTNATPGEIGGANRAQAGFWLQGILGYCTARLNWLRFLLAFRVCQTTKIEGMLEDIAFDERLRRIFPTRFGLLFMVFMVAQAVATAQHGVAPSPSMLFSESQLGPSSLVNSALPWTSKTGQGSILQKKPTISKVIDRTRLGLVFDFSRSGQSLGPMISYTLSSNLTLAAQAMFSNMAFPQLMCLVTSIDTLALVRGSQFYFGDDHREANLIVGTRHEFSAGLDYGVGDRIRFTSSLRLGLRSIKTLAEVDEELTPEAARRRQIFGCGDFFIGTPKFGGPQELQRPTSFETSAITGVIGFGSGIETTVLERFRLGLQLQVRRNLYGNTRFRVRDTRQPGMGSEILRLVDHAPLVQWQMQVRLLAPLAR